MHPAKYYVYRNLNAKCFSIRYREKVIAHVNTFTAYGVTFKDNEKSRQRCLDHKRRNVHAFLVCDEIHYDESLHSNHLSKYHLKKQVSYNPFKGATFFHIKTKKPVLSAKTAVGINWEKVFIQ